MHNKNYSGQNLRGRSFVGRDLSGADFSDCDLRGVDFSGANLKGAKFCRARLGRALKMTWGLLVLQLLLSVVAGIAAGMGSKQFEHIKIVSVVLYGNSEFYQYVLMDVYALVFAACLFLSLMHQNWGYLFFYFIVNVVVNASMFAFIPEIVPISTYGITTMDMPRVMAGAMTGASTLANAIVAAVAVAVGGVGVGIGAILILTISAIRAGEGVGAAGAAAGVAGIAGVVVGGIIFALGFYLSYRAHKKEEPQLLFLRHFGVQLQALGGTQFAFATLHDCNFSQADLKHARFKNAKLQGCNFQHAKNAHLALTRSTPLEFKKVRELVVNRKLIDSDFAGLNLQGLDFSGLDLQHVNFANANISFADFSDADLRKADLSEVTALSTRFSRCKLTAACIEHWNIDSGTRLDDIDCRFVYLKRDPSECNPPTGEFAAGEFTKLYQEIADTLDFVAHNPNEYEAIITAIDQVRIEGCDELFVQSIEHKDGAVVIRVKAPPEFDRNQVYAKIQQEAAAHIQVLETRHKQALLEKDLDYLQRENALKTKHEDLLAEVLKKTVGQPLTVQNIVGQDVNSINNSPISNSSVNLGANSTVSNSIGQLPEQFGELKSLLTALQATIQASGIPDADKQQAAQHTQNLAQAATQPEQDRLAIVKNTCRWFKGLTEELKDLPETATQIGETVAKIALLMGL